jgi:integrase
MPLTTKEIINLKTEKDIMICDGKGLYLEVSRTGVKRWWFRYQFNGRARKMPLDYFPSLSLSDAHLESARLRAMLKDQSNPQDPMEVRNTALVEAERLRQAAHDAELVRQAQAKAEAAELAARLTFQKLFERWKKVQLVHRKDQGEEIERAFIKDILPVLGSRFAEDITRKDISLLLNQIVDRGARRMANRILSDLRQCFGYGISSGLLENDPTSHLKKSAFGGKEESRERTLSDKELRLLLTQALPSSNLSSKGKAAVHVLLSTAARVGELLRVERTHLNLDDRTWIIPDEHAKNGNAHVIYLSDFASRAFSSLLALEEHKTWLFPNRDGESHVCIKTLTKQIGDRQTETPMQGRSKDSTSLSLPGGRWTPHDLRRTAATLMGDLGTLPHVIEKCLNHTEANQIIRTYQRQKMIEEQKQAFTLLGQKLTEMTL